MNSPVQAILDGLSAAGMHWQLVAGIFLLLLISLLLLTHLLHNIFGGKLAAEEYLSLSLAGWLLPASLISILWYAGAKIISPQLSLILIGLILSALLTVSLRNFGVMARALNLVSLSLFVLAGLFILIRLAYLSKTVLPLYFDSAQHYRYINQILGDLDLSRAVAAPLTGYYHLGFHFLAAFVTFPTRAEISDTMLVLGQVILALMPFSAFFIVRHGSGSNSAGFLALALAAFGWYMPAHAVDWGKYPALASLALLPFVLVAAYLYTKNRSHLPSDKKLLLMIFLTAGALLSVVLHSRSLVVYALLAIAWPITTAWRRLAGKTQLLVLVLSLLFVLGEIMYIRSQGILGPLLDAYGQKTLLVSVLVLVLTGFAWRQYSSLVMFCVISIALLLASLFISLGNLIPGYTDTTLLDRPYVQMILYLPLTLLTGFGMAGLEHSLEGRKIVFGKSHLALSHVIAACFVMLVTVNALRQYKLYPDDCCLIVSRDDLAAIHWMAANLPQDARILTSSTDLKVLPTDQFQGSAGGDAGTWITPLIGHPVTYLPYSTDFSQQQTLDILCQQQVKYVYVGKTGWFFDDTKISIQPDAYRLLLDLPKARVYEINGCKGGNK